MCKPLSYDGKGINVPDVFKLRIATFSNQDAAYKYGNLFAASPLMLAALEDVMREFEVAEDVNEENERVISAVRSAIKAAKGGR